VEEDFPRDQKSGFFPNDWRERAIEQLVMTCLRRGGRQVIKVELDRCGYCGACVGVCPVGAIELAETHLLINEACFDCDLCLTACPVGALKAEDYAETDAVPLRRRYDVVVVGAGPGGSVAAREAARLGLSVLLLEKRQEIGSPVRCAEGVAHDLLTPFIEPDPHWISAVVSKAQIEVIGGGITVARQAERGNGYILERRVFDRVLAEEAAKAGAQVMVKTAATGLLLQDGAVRGVVTLLRKQGVCHAYSRRSNRQLCQHP